MATLKMREDIFFNVDIEKGGNIACHTNWIVFQIHVYLGKSPLKMFGKGRTFTKKLER